MGETLTREHMVSWLAAVEASPWRTVGAPQADLRTALEMARASLDLAEQFSAAQRELVEVRAAVQAYLVAEYEYERWSSRDTQTAKANALDTLRAALEDKGNG